MAEWTYNGTPLTSAGKWRGYCVEGYDDPPDLRGDNIVIPLVAGRTYVPKFGDQQTLMFVFTLQGTSSSDLQSNIEIVKSVFSNQTVLHTLVRVYPSGNSKSCSAEAINFHLLHDGPKLAKATVDFVLPNPIWV
jgi:hypothetical protein